MKRIALAVAALAVAAFGAVNHYSSPAQPAHDPAADAAVAAVQAPDRFGRCLPRLGAVNPRYTARDMYVPHAPATVRYTVAGGQLVFSITRSAKARSGVFTVPADTFTTEALDKAACW